MIPAILDSGITIDVSQLPPGMLADLEGELTIANPAYAAATKRGRVPFRLAPTIGALGIVGDEVRIPRGFAGRLRAIAQEHDETIKWREQRVLPEQLDGLRAVSLRPYQERCVSAFIYRQQGLLLGPCGCGKTRMGVGAISRLRTPSIVLVASLDLAQQWIEQIREVLGCEAGLIGDGTYDVRPITVALVQSLSRRSDAELDVLLGQFGLLIIDEAHHTPAETVGRIVDRSPAKYRLGLTATPDREDGLGPMLGWYVGPIVAEVSHEELIACGALIAPELVTVPTDFSFVYRGPNDYAALLDALEANEARNQLIVDTIEDEVRDGHSCLALSGRVAHCKHIADALIARGVIAIAMTGALSKKRRAEILDGVRDGSVQVLVATQIADEGLDCPRLSRVFLTFPARAKGRTEQRLGRIMRPHPSKSDAIVYDFADVRVGVLRYQHRIRREALERVIGAAVRSAA